MLRYDQHDSSFVRFRVLRWKINGMLKTPFTRRWIFATLLVIAAIGVMVRLGFWQLERLAERRAFNTRATAQIAQPPLELSGKALDGDQRRWNIAPSSWAFRSRARNRAPQSCLRKSCRHRFTHPTRHRRNKSRGARQSRLDSHRRGVAGELEEIYRAGHTHGARRDSQFSSRADFGSINEPPGKSSRGI